jgi:outer membrane protein OmpA-like peptidoglycan-associated protein
MIHKGGTAALTAICAVGLTSACGPRRIEPPPERPGQTLTVLLPDPDSGTVGRVSVTNPSGNADLAEARASTTTTSNQPPGPVVIMSEADVQRLFGDALAALPPAPQSFTLFFAFDSDELTPESRVLMADILQAVKTRPAPDVIAVGHTDTTGSSASNFALGLKRAVMVQSFLKEAGLEVSVEVTTLGETDLLVLTADEVAEPRNRRVEVVVR